jgi:hypothetical protein
MILNVPASRWDRANEWLGMQMIDRATFAGLPTPADEPLSVRHPLGVRGMRMTVSVLVVLTLVVAASTGCTKGPSATAGSSAARTGSRTLRRHAVWAARIER